MRLLALFTLLSLQLVATQAFAALPPFELVQKSLAKARAEHPKMVLDLRVTETAAALKEWDLRGTFRFGDRPARFDGDSLAIQFLWIATLSADPVAELQRTYGLVNANVSTVGVQDSFVYVYGVLPAVSVYRDLQRLAAFSVKAGTQRWVTRLTWDEDQLSGIMVTRDGKTVLTARRR